MDTVFYLIKNIKTPILLVKKTMENHIQTPFCHILLVKSPCFFPPHLSTVATTPGGLRDQGNCLSWPGGLQPSDGGGQGLQRRRGSG